MKTSVLLLQYRKNDIIKLVLFLVILVLPLSCKADILLKETSPRINQHATNQFIVILHEIVIDIQNSENIQVNETLTIQNNSTDSIDSCYLWINESFTDLKVEDSISNLVFEYCNGNHCISINFRHSIEVGQVTKVILSYKLDRQLFLIENSNPPCYPFYFRSTITYLTQKQEVQVWLPETSFVSEQEHLPPLYPTTDHPILIGYRVVISWTFLNLLPESNPSLAFYFDAPFQQNKPIWYYIVGPILALTLGIFGTIWLMRRRESKAVKKLGSIFLSDVQKEFMKIIIENEGKISQKEITTITGYTKTRVSRNLISLERQQLIRREKWGRNYKIFITETGEQVIE